MLAARPFNVILPVDDPQVVGLAEMDVMVGLGKMVTVPCAAF